MKAPTFIFPCCGLKKTRCGQKPERVLVYRDGVSEGQFSAVLKNEVASLRAGCRRLDAKYNPKVTFVVVQKRHHARFFPMNPQGADRSGNCHPGTCVDTTIVHPFEFDFYIQSHAGILGTSRPTHYQVLQDDNMFSSDDLQSLTYNLCHLYARATRTVSVVPAVYYAHIVAARAKFHAKGGHWSDNQSTESGTGFDQKAYAAVKPDLFKGKELCSVFCSVMLAKRKNVLIANCIHVFVRF